MKAARQRHEGLTVDTTRESGPELRRRNLLLLAAAFTLSLVLVALGHYVESPTWLGLHFPATAGSDATLWQVQTTFLSVGFAGLAIAAQLFSESPLAIGASRGRVLHHVWADQFVGAGLIANAVTASAVLWMPSDLGTFVCALWLFLTVVLLVMSTRRLVLLFGRPSILDELTQRALVDALTERLSRSSEKYASSRRQLEGVFDEGEGWGSPDVSILVPSPRIGLVVKGVKTSLVLRAKALLGPPVSVIQGDDGVEVPYNTPQIWFQLEPGDRTRYGDVAFQVRTVRLLDDITRDRVFRLLQSSVEFEPLGTVTPDEETDREIANLKDTIGTSLRSGAFGTSERALALLGHVVRGVWIARPDHLAASRRSSLARRDWIYRSIGEVEQDALLSPRACDLFVSQAMERAIEAPRTGLPDYVDECLRSFTRIWSDVLASGDRFDAVPSRIVTCVQNLAAYPLSGASDASDAQARATWAMVEMVKTALDSKQPEAARLAARELDGLSRFAEIGGRDAAHVRAGQLVLAGWLDYLADKGDERDPSDPELRTLVTPDGTRAEILSARSMLDRGATPFSRWDWWEMKATSSGQAQLLELSKYIDHAELAALAAAYGPLPTADDHETAFAYKRLFALLSPDGLADEAPNRNSDLGLELAAEVAKWDAAEEGRLAREPLSTAKLDELRAALVEALNRPLGLTAQIPLFAVAPGAVDTSQSILGMNIRVPRYYLVDGLFNNTYADPKDLGRMIARGFVEGEERRIVRELRALQCAAREPTVGAVREEVERLGDLAEHFVLATPFDGLGDPHEWYLGSFVEVLSRVTHVRSASLDGEAFLFDARTTLSAVRRPEEKDGLAPVPGSPIALGMFDVEGQDEPQARIEASEYFVVWQGDAPHVVRFAAVGAV